MTKETDAVATAAADLTHAMSRLVKAIDDLGDDRLAVQHVPEDLAPELERLVGRMNDLINSLLHFSRLGNAKADAARPAGDECLFHAHAVCSAATS